MGEAFDKIRLWFFRDLTESQRLKLFLLFGLPVAEIDGSHERQLRALEHVTAPQPSGPVGALEAEIERLREIVRRYGDKMRMSFAPAHLQQSIDTALSVITAGKSEQAVPGGSVKVKPLAWREPVVRDGRIVRASSDWSYEIRVNPQAKPQMFMVWRYGQPLCGYSTEEKAEAAAQADHEQRVLSAIA